jgi:SAM-dependent methyltransferase
MMRLKIIILRVYFFLNSQVGIDPVKMFRFIYGIPRYIHDFFCFRKEYSGQIKFQPCLHDWYEEGGATKDEYFLQDLLVARKIFEADPERHVDIGSRVDGFVAHVASFRTIEVFDVRPITTQIPNVVYKQADFLKPLEGKKDYCDSLSCLHALEHFGLGRYGDPIVSEGFVHGFVNMSALLRPGGTFYLSVPIGISRVEFNANRVFDPHIIVKLAGDNSFELSNLTIIRQNGKIESFAFDEDKFSKLACQRYSLGIFTFVKQEAKIDYADRL